MTARINAEPRLIKNICFSKVSKKCTFYLNRHANKQNYRYWNETNPVLLREGHTQYSEKVNIWAVILEDATIGPLFIEGNLNGEMYAHMLEISIEPERYTRKFIFRRKRITFSTGWGLSSLDNSS